MKSRLLNISLHIFITLLVLHHQYPLLSQFNSLGQTDISHYSKYDYGGGTESWDIGLLENGHLLVANNDGLMIFNGMDWEIFKLPNRSITRSLEVSKSGRIYVGGQDEVGYFFPASNGTLVFHSIREQIPDQYLPLQDVWQILIDGSKVYFRSVNRIYIFDETESTFKVEDPNGTISCLGKIYDEIVYADIENGIQSLSESEAAWWEEANLEGLNISHILPWKDEIILVTEQKGLFVLGSEQAKSIQTPLNEKLKELAVFSVIKMSDDRLVFGTQFGGLIISDRDGSMISRFDSSTGLSKDDVRCIALDQQNNLWIGTSNGIDRIQMESPLRIIQPDAEQEEIFYDAVDFNGRLYLGSNVNLYSTSINNASSDLLASQYITYPQAKGQVWGLDKINDELILCHHEGAFQVSSEGIQKFSETNGVWKCIPANNPDEMYVGTYTGIDIYRKEDGTWVFLKKIEGFLESARILISTQKNEVWVSHPYRGVYKITHDNNYLVSSVKLYDEQKGLPSTLLNYIFKINNTPYVTAKKGIYRLDVLHDRFVLDSTLNKNISPDQNVRRLFQNTDGDIWFVAERECGLLSLQDDGQYEKRLFPILKDKFVGGFEKIFFLDNEHLLACTNENVLSVDLSQNVIRKRPTVFLDQVTNLALGDSVIFGGYSSDDNSLIFQQSSDMQYAFEPAENSFSFQFSSPQHDGRVAYRYQLAEEESDTSWTNWSSKVSKEYNHLSHGEYIFMVQAKLENGGISDPATFAFSIRTPWFISTPAIIIYLLSFTGLILSLILVPNQKLKKEKEKLLTEKEASDAKVELIQEEKLKAEIDFKTTELATSTMHLVQKNETISKIKSEIEKVRKNIKDPTAKKEMKRVISLLSDDERLENEWENFSTYFDQVHTDFLKRISKGYPQLTSKDKKLCAYLRLNLSTKEIAPLMNISVRGVEISRYRLRKKMELEKSANLNDYMMNY